MFEDERSGELRYEFQSGVCKSLSGLKMGSAGSRCMFNAYSDSLGVGLTWFQESGGRFYNLPYF